MAPRAYSYHSVITPCTHGYRFTVDIVRHDRNRGGSDVVPFYNPTQGQVLDYHALSKDFRLMTKSNSIGLDSCVEV